MKRSVIKKIEMLLSVLDGKAAIKTARLDEPVNSKRDKNKQRGSDLPFEFIHLIV